MTDKNVGPYIIRNTLATKAKYDNLLFFDADDIMNNNMISTILSYYNESRPIRFKYLNFIHGNNYLKGRPHSTVAHGVFFISKKIFDGVGGFQPWMCGADTEFMKRCSNNGIIDINISNYIFYRRIHNQSLTQNKSTRYRSKIRDVAVKFIKTNKNWSIPINRKTTELIKI